ncbi:hypothetical protein WMQ26_22080, partial [Vibrio diabolicus]|uniref:hypothetical protein n=1 Tax=Vibrio diabolicus TaxID=50719 RepID=UPI0037538735
FGYFLFHAFSMKPQKDHSTGNSGSSAAGHISEAVNEGLVNGYEPSGIASNTSFALWYSFTINSNLSS